MLNSKLVIVCLLCLPILFLCASCEKTDLNTIGVDKTDVPISKVFVSSAGNSRLTIKYNTYSFEGDDSFARHYIEIVGANGPVYKIREGFYLIGDEKKGALEMENNCIYLGIAYENCSVVMYEQSLSNE